MTSPGRDAGSWPTFHGGWRLLPVRVRFAWQLLRYRLRRRRYPLFLLGARHGGVLASLGNIRRMHVDKPVRFRGAYHVSVTMPRWPSRAYDAMAARGGLNVRASGTSRKRHVDLVILAITRRCAYSCAHCYEKANLHSAEAVPVAVWRRVIQGLQAISTGVIVLSGGEPLLRYEALLDLVASVDPRRSDVHINTSGHGVSPTRARELARAGLVAAGIGLDDPDAEKNDALRGHAQAHAAALAAARHFREAGVLPYFNVCMTTDLVRSGRLWALLDLAQQLGVGILRLLEPKPAGNYAGLSPEALFSEVDRARVRDFLKRANGQRRYRHHPLVSYVAHEESVVGCLMGGLGHFAIDALGHVRPCVFAPVSFGNVAQETIETVFERMRADTGRPRLPCPAVRMAEAIPLDPRKPDAVPRAALAEEQWRQWCGPIHECC